ncbi:MAG: hypothetical protein LAT67_04970 [Balneolales bacterium]|nr:hypothetical protein [Balneolales bacterium]
MVKLYTAVWRDDKFTNLHPQTIAMLKSFAFLGEVTIVETESEYSFHVPDTIPL